MSLRSAASDKAPVAPHPRAASESQAAAANARLGVRVERPYPGTVIVTVHGEIDLCTAPRLGAFLRARMKSFVDVVVLDLDGVTFVDSAGLEMLGACQHRADRHGVRLCLVDTVRNPVVRLLDRMGMGDQFHVLTSIEELSSPALVG